MRSTTRKNKHAHYQPSARVVDGTLVLTLPNARTPTVWRMGLEAASAASFQVVQAGDRDGHTLVMSAPDDQQYDIASFDDRDAAIEALLAASGAMQDAGHKEQAASPGAPDYIQVAPAAKFQHDAQRGRSGRGRGVLIAAGVALIVILLYMIANTGPQRFGPNAGVADSAGSGTRTGGAQQRSMSAEQFLQQKQ